MTGGGGARKEKSEYTVTLGNVENSICHDQNLGGQKKRRQDGRHLSPARDSFGLKNLRVRHHPARTEKQCFKARQTGDKPKAASQRKDLRKNKKGPQKGRGTVRK